MSDDGVMQAVLRLAAARKFYFLGTALSKNLDFWGVALPMPHALLPATFVLLELPLLLLLLCYCLADSSLVLVTAVCLHGH